MRFLQMGNELVESAFARLTRHDHQPLLAPLQQTLAGGQVEFRARFLAAMTLHAVLLEHYAHIALEESQPLDCVLGVLLRHFRRR